MVLTCKEEQILGKMRELKSDVRTITERLSEIKGRFTNGGTPELHSLSNRLDELRAEWRDWSAKLDEAIEHKLVMLGHRESKT
jgi:DNA repair exonuclease SbcCD ATPase subunit